MLIQYNRNIVNAVTLLGTREEGRCHAGCYDAISKDGVSLLGRGDNGSVRGLWRHEEGLFCRSVDIAQKY